MSYCKGKNYRGLKPDSIKGYSKRIKNIKKKKVRKYNVKSVYIPKQLGKKKREKSAVILCSVRYQ